MKTIIMCFILSSSMIFSNEWQKVDLGNLGIIYDFDFTKPNNGYLTSFKGKGIFKSENNGATWNFINLNLTKEPLSITFYENHGWLGTSTMSGALDGEILYTSDNGENWASVYSFNNEIPIQIRAIDSNHIFLMLIKKSYYSIKMSTDKGFNWIDIDEGNEQVLGSFKINNKFFWYGFSGNLKYYENGVVKEINNDLLNNYDLHEVKFIDDDIGFASCNKGKIFKTINKGLDWEDISNGIPSSNRINCVYFVDEIIGWASGYDTIQNYAFIYSTIDGGNNWKEDLKIDNSKFYDFTISNNNNLWIRGNNSLLYYKDLSTGIKENSNKNCLLYPNPAADYITINLSSINPTLKSGVEGEVVVEIYDVMGMKIQTELIHPLTPSHRMNIESLTPGVYFVKIGDRVEKFVKY